MLKVIKPGLIIFFVVAQMAVVASWAKTLYVSDVLYITLRSGPSDEFRILKSLKSGTHLELVEQGDDQHSLVRTEDGVEGWVQHRFLTDEPVAAEHLEKAEAELARLGKENTDLKDKLTGVRGDLKETEKERKRLESEYQSLESKQEKLEKVAAKPMQLDQENTDLRTRNAELQKELDQVKREISGLTDESGRNWFLAGAGVIVLGIFIGLLVPRLRMRKNSSWA